MAALQNELYEVLTGQGLTDMELLAVAASGPTWESRAEGYEEATFPVMVDTAGVYLLYSADPYDVVLVDKQGRLVTRRSGFTEEMIPELIRKLRDLHAE